MKQCPRCRQTYSDESLNFCLEDGEPLTAFAQEPPPARYVDDSPPTVMLNEARATNPASWPNPASPPAQWQPQPVMQYQQATLAQYGLARSQTLATVSLALGIASVTVGWCCSLGLLLGPGALITGLIALSQIKKDPERYGGRGLALGGAISGGVFLGLYLLFILIYGLAVIGGGLLH